MPDDALAAKPAAPRIRRSAAAPAAAQPFALHDDAMRERMECMRMSNAEREAAIAALQLGRDIGRLLERLGRVLRRVPNLDHDEARVRHVAMRNRLLRTRKAGVYGRLTSRRLSQ